VFIAVLGPFVFIKFNSTSISADDKFFNSQGQEIKSLPTSFAILASVVSIINFIIFTKYFGKLDINSQVDTVLFFLIFLSGFCTYFIIKNCPISLIFSRHWWAYLKRITPVEAQTYHESGKPYSSSKPVTAHRSSGAHIYSPAYSSNSGNVYHRSRY
jgi:hypothetical protein